MPLPVRSIVVRRDDNLGDIVIALPVLKALRANFPKATLTVMVKEYQRVLCEKFADSFLDPVPLDQFSDIAKQFDLAFNIDYFGPGNREKQTLQLGAVNHINAVRGSRRRPIVHHLMDGLPAFGLEVPRFVDPRFPIPSNTKQRVNRWLSDAGIRKKRHLWIGIHVGSRVNQKCWSIEKFTQLSQWLYRSFDARLFFFGTANEEHAIRSIALKLPTGVTKTIIGQPIDFVAGVLARMDFFIGNDSGVGHLASAVRTPTVSIFGPSSPTYWRPSGQKSIVVYKDSKNINHTNGPVLSVDEVKQGVLLCIQRHITRDDFAPLDRLRLSRGVQVVRTAQGIVVQASKRGPACLVADGWRRVKQILDSIQKHNSYRETLHRFPDAGPLLDLFILHGIIHQGYVLARRIAHNVPRTAPPTLAVRSAR